MSRQLFGGPLAVVADVLTRPNDLGRNRPLYPMNVVDRLRGRTLPRALDGRVVMVTGASSGIGMAVAEQVGAAGGTVVLVARRADRLDDVARRVEESGGTAHVFACDLTDAAAQTDMIADVLGRLGRVDVLVNNAGRSIRRSLHLSYNRAHDYERTMELNYFSAVRSMLGLLPGMRERRYGQIINISTMGVQTRTPRFGAYVASKAALDVLCDTWQSETRRENVRFTTIYMPLVRTPMIEATPIYDMLPALTPEDAATIVTDAIVRRPRRVSAPVGQLAAMTDAFSPDLMDRVRSRGVTLFGDSKAARGQTAPVTKSPAEVRATS